MRALDSVLQNYKAVLHSKQIASTVLNKSRKAVMFHGTVFHGESFDSVERLMTTTNSDLDDLFTLLLIATFEDILFNHPNSPLGDDLVRENVTGVTTAVKHFEDKVSQKQYLAITQLCRYRDWVAHGKRWSPPPPQPAGPDIVCQQLMDFLSQAGLQPIPSALDL